MAYAQRSIRSRIGQAKHALYMFGRETMFDFPAGLPIKHLPSGLDSAFEKRYRLVLCRYDLKPEHLPKDKAREAFDTTMHRWRSGNFNIWTHRK